MAAAAAGLQAGPLTDESDPTSFSNFHDIVVRHLHLDLTASFTSQTLSGEARLTMAVLNPALTHITLDTNHLDIHAVAYVTPDDDTPHPLTFHLEPEHPAFGRALRIDPPPPSVLSSSSPLLLSIRYSTTSDSSGIQWLPPAQTAGKTHPYAFTQFQAIHARSGIPLQDTPAVKAPYTAHLTVPRPLVALMSAPNLSSTPASSTATTHTFHFSQPTPTPSYLLAIAIGALEARRVGPRSQVWSEKETVDAGAWEFADTEQFLSVAEGIVGQYVWGTYDLLLLPPSFPYGGMENPSLTFLTPTLIAGDRSLVSVVAHEASHSWMGNFVGCANWQSFWCNEGFCVFLERKILKQLKGEQMFHLDAIVGRQALQDAVKHVGEEHPYTVLQVELKDIDPDDAFSSVPYEKGFALLYHLEQLVGGDAVMNPFLRAYCQHFAYGTVTSQSFKAFFLGYFQGKVDDAKLAGIDWDTWLHKPGMPPDPHFDRTLVNEAEALAKRWMTNPTSAQAVVPAPDVHKWDSDQTVWLLQSIKKEYKESGADRPALVSVLTGLDSVYHFTDSRNCEIRFAWLTLVVEARLSSLYPAVSAFITQQGRMKYIRPLYRQLYESGGEGRQMAVDTFTQHRTQYHAIAQKMVAKDLKLHE